jgi:predicted kinase
VSRLIHLNGPPGVGKSTLAQRYAADHPGALLCDIDKLRTMVAGWEDDSLAAGARIRTAALAMITAYLHDGGDVVVPQLVADPAQLVRFRAAATDAHATYLHVVLTAAPDDLVRRFRGRGDDQPWDAHARVLVDGDGGNDSLHEWTRRLEELGGTRVPSTDLEATYAELLVALR